MRTLLLILSGWIFLTMTTLAHAAEGLTNTKWSIESVKDATVTDPSKTRLSIDATGAIATTVGCNQMSGTATLDANKISIGPLAATRMACEPTLMDLEQKYRVALNAARSFRLDGASLQLLDQTGTELVRFSKIP